MPLNPQDFLAMGQSEATRYLRNLNDEEKLQLKTNLQAFSEAKQTKKPLLQSLGKVAETGVEYGERFFDVASQFSLGALETLDNLGSLLGVEVAERDFDVEPKGLAQQTARLIGGYAAPSPAGPAGGILTKAVGNGAGVIPKVGQIPNKAALKADRLLNGLAETSGKALGFIGEVLTSVPREAYERALKNPQLFKMGKITANTYRDIGTKAQKALNFIVGETGENVGKMVDDVVRTSQKSVKPDSLINSIDDLVQTAQFGRSDPLTVVDMNKINKIYDHILELGTDPKKPMLTMEELHGTKKMIDNLVSYTQQTVRKASPQGERVLKTIRGQIDDILKKSIDGYEQANKAASNAQKLKGAIINQLKDENLSRSIKTIFKNENQIARREILKQIDELAPDGLKFYDDLNNAVVKEAFDEIFPGRGGGSGSAQGFANFLRLTSAGTVGATTSPALGAALLIGTSPKTGGFITKGLAKKGKRRLIGRVAGVEAIRPRFEEEQ